MSLTTMIDQTLDLHNQLAYYKALAEKHEADALYWRQAYRKAISHDHAIIQHLKEASDGAAQ